jgi:hypothetical protein
MIKRHGPRDPNADLCAHGSDGLFPWSTCGRLDRGWSTADKISVNRGTGKWTWHWKLEKLTRPLDQELDDIRHQIEPSQTLVAIDHAGAKDHLDGMRDTSAFERRRIEEIFASRMFTIPVFDEGIA